MIGIMKLILHSGFGDGEGERDAYGGSALEGELLLPRVDSLCQFPLLSGFGVQLQLPVH